ncbi:hypothetical protein IU468_19630 [Nocardia farcinica]|uniref:hypothetical protein n=1 Tax=Nocardia farcinica TaxID=37329 RepID=UPI0018956DAB|nr:hypothetical protein [Nocardia farcinica]MBF6258516.1 hypothetical protein [Nocardia farcinica]
MSEAHPAVEVVTYDGLPAASGGAHRLRTRNPRLAWEAVQSFLDACVLPVDDRLAAAARHLQHHLPVRLSPKHWRRWRPTRDGSSYRSTKIPSPLPE